ncbi:MAG TPA: DUF488 domain-containing protein [Bacillota bacterium]|nr:DUF488 domain-containing protein [Bacillota bacterium]
MGTGSKEPLTVFNIGYQGHTIDSFVLVLRGAGITILVDLREKPYSRMPGFSKNKLRETLESGGMAYRWMGSQLGGFTCTVEMWRQGCAALAELARGGEKVAIMCMERDWQKCHRAKLVEILALEHKIQSLNL